MTRVSFGFEVQQDISSGIALLFVLGASVLVGISRESLPLASGYNHKVVTPGYHMLPILCISVMNLLLVISALFPVACIVCSGVLVSGV